MAITATDIRFFLSSPTGPGKSTAGSPASSFGDFVSSTQITDASDNNLFDDISGDENAASTIDYRNFFVENNHATLSWITPVAWISAEVSGGASVAIAVDDVAASLATSASAQAEESANELTAPTGPTFTAPTTKGTGIALATIPAVSVRAIWVRRTAANSAALNADGATIRCEGDTAA